MKYSIWIEKKIWADASAQMKHFNIYRIMYMYVYAVLVLIKAHKHAQ